MLTSAALDLQRFLTEMDRGETGQSRGGRGSVTKKSGRL